MFNFSTCRSCKGNSDPQTDTLKVTLNPPVDLGDKENAAPGANAGQCALQLDAADAELGRLQMECEEQKRQEEERRQEEIARQQAAEEERQRVEEEQRQQEEERRRKEEELKRQEEEAEALRLVEEARRREQLMLWLSKNGCQDVNEKKKKSGMISSGFTYPLHMAVKGNDLAALSLLVWGGADKQMKDSAKLTPLALAQKLDKKGSHREVVEALSA